MSDDIDIEEHDVLDNPTIRRIFPDLSIIKKEISQYEEGFDIDIEEAVPEPNADNEQATGNKKAEPGDLQHVVSTSGQHTTFAAGAITDETPTNKQLEVHRRFKYFLDSLVDDFIEINTNNSDTTSVFNDIVPSKSPKLSNKTDQSGKADKFVQNNIFILGSKPSIQHIKKTNKEKKQLKIVLKNVGPYLNASRRYCKECFILFPNINELKCHMSNLHSIKRSNSMIKTKSKMGSKKSCNVKFQCEICTIKLSSKGNLVRHFKRVHNTNKISKPGNLDYDKGSSLRGSTKVNDTKNAITKETETKSIKSFNCFHCHKFFESRSALIEHLYEVLNPYKIVSSGFSKSENTTKKADTIVDKGKDGEKLVVSKEIKSISAITQRSSDKVSHNKNNHSEINKLKRNKLKRTSTEDNEKKFYENQKSKNPGNLKKTKCSSTEKDKYIDNNDSDTQLDDYLDNQSTDCSISDSGQKTTAGNSSHSVDTNLKQFYQCFICSQYMIYNKSYFRHMCGHNIKDVHDVEQTIFDAQCKFCSIELTSIKAYNIHISRKHRAKLVKKVNFDEKAFQSILFKCYKCDVFFLTANAAMSHSEHEKIFLNWKCLKCNEFFKINDKSLHLKQHSLSNNITSYVLSESELNRVLYKCLKCTVHFSENEYFLHNTCDLEIPNSAYCKTCDILINKTDMAFHESNHEEKSLQLFDFAVIESDIITNNEKESIDKKTNPYERFKYALTFCYTCNCFLNNLATTRGVHSKGSCATVISPRICRRCGLVFTASGYRSHKILHDKIKNLNLQAYYFYDMKSKEQMLPPVPKFPSCDICEVHFLNKSAIKEHECSKQSFRICDICKIKLTEAAFRLHTNYHKYKLSSSIFKKLEKEKLKVDEAADVLPTTNTSNIVTTNTSNTVTTNPSDTVTTNTSHTVITNSIHTVTTNTSSTVKNLSLKKRISFNSENVTVDEMQKILYTCITCKITIDTYDKVVQHCHDHYDYPKIQSSHKLMDSYSKSDKEFARAVTFDPFYFRFKSNVWIEHIFANLTMVQIHNVLKHSMYKFEGRLKMEEIQSGSNSMALYKCDICRSFIDPDQIFLHASNVCSILSKKHPCLTCGLCFYSEIYRHNHEKDHGHPDIKASSYRIILFNKIEHQYFTRMMFDSLNKFILYQCRNCEVIVDKLQRYIHQCNNEELIKCTSCGLLLYYKELNSHVTKHKVIKDFRSDQMVIIMFGKLGSQVDNKQVKSSFSGTVFDLSFYRCTNCGLCVKTKTDMSNHVCIFKSYIVQCPKCYLYFKKKEIQEHYQFHESNLILGYDDFNSNIVTFSNDAKKTSQESLNQGENDKNTNINTTSTQTIYKCSCGLHFLEKHNANKHYNNCSPKMKISKQSCIKCDLLFTPGELFDHLLKHHGNKKLRYKYDIISISESIGET